MTPAPVSMKFFTARPLRGAIRPSYPRQTSHQRIRSELPQHRAQDPILGVCSSQVPSGTAIAISVSTKALPLLGTQEAPEAYMSYPAAKALPLVGVFAEGESFLTSRGGDWDMVVTGAADVGVGGAIGLERFDNGDAGSEGGW